VKIEYMAEQVEKSLAVAAGSIAVVALGTAAAVADTAAVAAVGIVAVAAGWKEAGIPAAELVLADPVAASAAFPQLPYVTLHSPGG